MIIYLQMLITPIPGTTKLSHQEENLRTMEFALSAEE